jgi:hypothetical protein
MVGDMSAAHRNFLIAFEQGAPDWRLLGLPDAKHLHRRALAAAEPRHPIA